MLTLDEFLAGKIPNSYIDHPEFAALYIRKGDVAVILDGLFYYCRDTVTVANVEAMTPGNGSFRRLLDDLISRNKAVYVECIHNARFYESLQRIGTPVNQDAGNHVLINYEGHLETPERLKNRYSLPS